MLINHADLKEILHYDEDTGDFYWKRNTSRCQRGQKAGSLAKDGYWRITIKRKEYRAHRLAWFYVTGKWPDHLCDHKNLNILDNRFENLREATHSQNQANKKNIPTSSSPYKGVTAHKNKWQAQIKVRGKYLYLGLFTCPEKAHQAYVEAANKYFKEYARAS